MPESIVEKSTFTRFYRTARRWWFVLIPFTQNLILLRLSPMMYDGWSGDVYYQNFGGILNWIFYICGPFRLWINGRIGSNLICGILESFTSEWVLDIVGALILTAIPVCLILLFKLQNRVLTTVVYCSLLALIPYDIRTYVIQIALPQYVAPVVFLMVSMVLINKYEESGDCGYVWWLYPLNFLACSWMENSSIAYGIVLSLCMVRITYHTRRLHWVLYGSVVCGLVAGLIMVTAPGMVSSRIEAAGGNGVFWSLGCDRIRAHLCNIGEHLVYRAQLVSLSIAILFFAMAVCKWLSRRNSVQGGIICLVNLAAIVVFIKLGFMTREFIYTEPLVIDYWYRLANKPLVLLIFVLGLYFFWLICNILLNLSWDWNVFTLLIFGAVCFITILPTNQIGSRIISPLFFIEISLIACAVGQVNTNYSRVSNCFISVGVALAVLLGADYHVQLCNRLYETGHERSVRIVQLQQDIFLKSADVEQYFVIPAYNKRDAYLGGITYLGTFHYPQFLNRYGLPSNMKIMFMENGQTESIGIDLADMENPRVHVEEQVPGNYSYDFTVSVRHNHYEPYTGIIYESNQSCDWSFKCVDGPGEYLVQIAKHDLDSEMTWYLRQTLEVTL